jgi:phosphopentomutase
MGKRVFLIVLDSFGIGAEPDAAEWGDEGSNTLCACATTGELSIPNMASLGLLNIEGALESPYSVDLKPVASPTGAFARLREASAGKDTTVGHWEMAGVISPKRFPTYPNGFPQEVLDEFERQTGRGVLCNKPYSGTQVIKDYGREQLETGKLIVYTSADSVFQIAAHEDMVSARAALRVLPHRAQDPHGRARRRPRHRAPLHGGVAKLRAHPAQARLLLWSPRAPRCSTC